MIAQGAPLQPIHNRRSDAERDRRQEAAQMENWFDEFPSLDDGPQGRTWTPAKPICAGAARGDKAFLLSLGDENGTVHRFMLTRIGTAWLVSGLLAGMSPWLYRPAMWWWRYELRRLRQSERSSGIPSSEGSPQEGQSV